jgi:predicted transposase YdaD
VFIDIMKNEVLGPVYRKGREEGREEGRQKGRQDGEITILRRLIEARFGRLPAWAGKRLAAKSTAELEELSVRVLSASSIRELLK